MRKRENGCSIHSPAEVTGKERGRVVMAVSKSVVIIPAEEVHKKTGESYRKLRVAAYCRVSTDEEKQLGSFENQIEYFTRVITENSKYELVKAYYDEGISGTTARRRSGFMEMISDCDAGKIDFILTKSISRFARNTQDSLKYTRELKEMGIGIYFEKEGLNTLESSGELLTLFSCFAQEESRSISENTAWGIRSKFKQGIPHLNTDIVLGYDKNDDGSLVINEEQAAIVRRIYRAFLEGYSLNGIAAVLNREGIKGVHGEAKWCSTTITRLLQNEKYKGDLLMQKTITANYLTKQHVRNTGQLDQYYVRDNHPAIIPEEEWAAVQEEIARRKEFRIRHHLRGMSGASTSPFYSRFFCANCGIKMNRVYQDGARRPRWQCASCGARIDDETLREAFVKAYNAVAMERERMIDGWESTLQKGSPLEKIRARQMIEITAEGPVPFEIPVMTQVLLEEACLLPENGLEFILHSGDQIICG